MNEQKNVLIGILGILLGLMVIIFPLISVFTVNAIAGVGIIFLGIWLIAHGFKSGSLAVGVASLILALFAIMLGIVFIADIKAFEFFSLLALYLVGLFLGLAGLTSLFSGRGLKEKTIGLLGILIGILFVIIGSYVNHPVVLAVIIGAFLIIAGIMEIFDMFGESKPEMSAGELKD